MIPQLVETPTLIPQLQRLLQCRRLWFDSWVGKILWRRDRLPIAVFLGYPWGLADRESTCNAGDLGLIHGLERSPGEEKDHSILAWRIPWTAVQGVAQSDFHFS